jgi:hypothetical protein
MKNFDLPYFVTKSGMVAVCRGESCAATIAAPSNREGVIEMRIVKTNKAGYYFVLLICGHHVDNSHNHQGVERHLESNALFLWKLVEGLALRWCRFR